LQLTCRARGILLIALTAYSGEADRLRTAQAGFDAHLVKPAETCTYSSGETGLVRSAMATADSTGRRPGQYRKVVASGSGRG
jgi:CheY-like chemotaxis protein